MGTGYTLAAVGVVVLAVGIAMPAETTETLYRNGEVIEKVWVNQYKTPTTVAGAVLTVGGLAAGALNTEGELGGVVSSPPRRQTTYFYVPASTIEK